MAVIEGSEFAGYVEPAHLLRKAARCIEDYGRNTAWFFLITHEHYAAAVAALVSYLTNSDFRSKWAGYKTEELIGMIRVWEEQTGVTDFQIANAMRSAADYYEFEIAK